MSLTPTATLRMNDITAIPYNTQPVIFSDLDGTLLDHNNYSYDPAIPSLKALQAQHTPIVFCTSKTFDETLELKNNLGINDPFIIENGAAICIPEHYFPSSLLQHHEIYAKKSGMLIYAFSEPRSHWQELLELVAQQRPNQQYWQSFAQLGSSGIAAATGLSEERATLANQREFGEPLLWQGSDAEKNEFIQAISALGAKPLQGGRFLHISGDCDKGTALVWLSLLYAKHFGKTVHTIAAGDSGNDIAMLEAADTAIIIQSPSHSAPKLTRNDRVFTSTLPGPAGWNEAMNKLILH